MFQESYLSYLISNGSDPNVSKHRLIYSLLNDIPWYKANLGQESKKVTVNPQIWNDLNLFTADKGESPISDHLDRTHTITGKIFLQKILSSPTSDTDALKWRQMSIKSLAAQQLRNTIDLELGKIKNNLSQILWFFTDLSKETEETHATVLFNRTYLNALNRFDTLLHWSNNLSILIMPAFSIFSPVLSILLPLIFLKVSGYIQIPWFSILKILGKYIYNYFWTSFFTLFSKLGKLGIILGLGWFGLFIYGIYSTFKDSWTRYQIIADIHKRLIVAQEFVNGVNRIYYHPQNKFFRNPIVQRSLFYLSESLNDPVLRTGPGITTDKGKILRFFDSLKSNNNHRTDDGYISLNGCLRIIIQYVGWVDCYLGLSKLIGENQENPYTYATYLIKKGVQKQGAHKPIVQSKGLWHPALTNKPKVLNDIDMDHNIILTGPNQGGKSTFIKSILLNIWLAQTISIVNARETRLTPFSMIHSYIQIMDTVGKESLFEAEMNRMKEFFDELNKNVKRAKSKRGNDTNTNSNSEYSFVVIDEIFTSTNYQEGLSASMAIAEELLKYPNNLSLLTTHYSQLTKICTGIPNRSPHFKNYQVLIQRGPEGIKFLYKIAPGVSNERIALDLISKKGFNASILNRAQHYLHTLF